MAVSSIATYVTDSTQVESTVQRLLGDGSVAQKKSEFARALEFLGWFVDLDKRTVTLCTRNLHKLLHALFCFDPLENVSIALIQRIASLASRTYATVHPRSDQTDITSPVRHTHVAKLLPLACGTSNHALPHIGVIPTSSTTVYLQVISHRYRRIYGRLGSLIDLCGSRPTFQRHQRSMTTEHNGIPCYSVGDSNFPISIIIYMAIA